MLGYFDGDTSDDGGRFVPLGSARIFDTRGAVAAASTTRTILGAAGIPTTGVQAVAMSIAVTEPANNGYVSTYPADLPWPGTSTVNFLASETVPNFTVTGTDGTGSVAIRSSAGPTPMFSDVFGYYTAKRKSPTAPSTTTTTKPPATTTTTKPPTTTTTKPPSTTSTSTTTTTKPPATTTTVPASGPTAGSSAREPVLAWLGTTDLDTLGPTGITRLVQNGVHGAVVMLGTCSSNPVPAWEITEWKWVSSQADLYVGCYLAAPTPASTSAEQADQRAAFQVVAAAAKSANAKGFALDAETYGGHDTAWDNVAGMKAYAQSLVPAIGFGEIQVYPSSNASWPGSYNDLIRAQNGEPGTYATNAFGDFVDGLLAGGARVNVTDASFDWGPQLRGDSWQTGVQRSVALAEQRFPSANFSASVMLWPDNDEGHGAFSPTEMQTAFDMATAYSTGPVFLYQHTLVGFPGTWPQWLSAIRAAVSG